MRKIVLFIALCAGLNQISGPARAQDVSALLTRSETMMRDMENNALRNTMSPPIGADTAVGSGTQGNAFYGVQEGQFNRIDATQSGLGNLIRVTQIGTAHSAVITQSGSFNQITVRQGR